MLSWQSPRNRPRSGTHASQARATLGADGLDSPTCVGRQNPTDQKRTQGGKPSLVWRCKQAREGATEVHEPTNILQAQGPRSLWLVWALRVAGWQALQAVPRRITIHCIHAALSPDPLPGRVAGGQHDARCDFFHAAPVAESHRWTFSFCKFKPVLENVHLLSDKMQTAGAAATGTWRPHVTLMDPALVSISCRSRPLGLMHAFIRQSAAR